jgi:N-acetylglucosaminyldiphosphoundecaprenol N-acetyl-beta-D-mannosaminyltransferase
MAVTPDSKSVSVEDSEESAAIEAQFSRAALLRRRIRHCTLTRVWQIALVISACSKRLVDCLVACLCLILFSPVMLATALLQGLSGGSVFRCELRMGRWAVPFSLVEFSTEGKCGGAIRGLRLHSLPSLINVVRGDMSLIGPRAARLDEMNARERAARKRSSTRPGLLSLWWLRKKANIHFGSELDVDLEYIDGQSFAGDFGIALRAIPSMLYGGSSATAPARIAVLGVLIDNLTMEESVQYILDAAAGTVVRQLCFVNTDCVNQSLRDPSYGQHLRKADLVLADGIGIRLAGKITRREFRQNVNGTDLFPRLCSRMQDSNLGLYLLGARPGIAEAFAGWIKANYPGVCVKGYRDGYFDPSQEATVLREIRASGAAILLVAFGSPRQDLWIGDHLPELGVRLAMGVGGLFDFYSGRIPRAPQWMRELSLEWIYRLYQEPRRMWRRYLVGNAVFLLRVIVSAIVHRSETAPSAEAAR